MPTFEFTSPEGKTYEVAGPDGATREQAFGILQQQIESGSAQPKEPSAVMSAGRAINDIPRQLGLTARYALTGPAKAAQIVTEPLRYVTDKFLPDRGQSLSDLVTGQRPAPKSTPLGVQAEKLADLIGLPKPQTPLERTIGDATELVAGAGGAAGAARGAANMLTGTGKAIAEGLSSNLPQQLAGAAGAGLAGGASREAGGTPGAQTGAALIGGIAGSFAPGGVANTVQAVRNLRPTPPAQLDVTIAQTLQRAGTDFSQLPPAVKAALRTEAATALRTGRELDPAALDRLATIRAVGATPTRGMVTQDPVLITREQNLAKTGANSADAGLQGLARVQNENNRALIGRLNDIGAASETLPVTAGRLVNERVLGTQAGLRGAEREAWDTAKSSPGYRAPVQTNGLQAITRALDAEDVLGDLPRETSALMEAYIRGQREFTPMAYRNIMSRLSRESNSADPAQAYAAGLARRTLEGAELMPIKAGAHLDSGGLPINSATAASMRRADAAPAEAVDLVNQARRATRSAYAYEDSSPLVRSVLSDGGSGDPQRIAQRFVIGGTPDEAATVAREVGPAGRETIRNALATHIKQRALSGAADETGKVSQSQLNAAIRSIGEEKLRLFFSPEEIATLKNAGRAASLMQSQPIGSAVNNSNSGALLLGRGLDLLDRVPLIGPMSGPALRNIETSIRQRQAQNVAPVLLRPQAPAAPAGSPLLLPGLALGGGLLSPTQQ